MKSPVSSIISQLKYQHKLTYRVIEGITHEHAVIPPSVSNNNMIWIAGHIVKKRYWFANINGAVIAVPFDNMFENYREEIGYNNYPSLNEVVAYIEKPSEIIYSFLETTPEEVFMQKVDFPNNPMEDNTLKV
jgi:hypothetical protein